ncbi:MAG: SGNH/GDSL hydrolase family protein [bacterium]|jgi:lysophospholipase L1-like esterase|nr:hypothetical protein [Deltaproteobacteria bacterium]MCP4244841.1 SGNH/GDSL hydrolase family protein [bacterium]MDP7301147.1 SGNH/GDSL hydrolase family protein [Myxococcota bacterium]
MGRPGMPRSIEALKTIAATGVVLIVIELALRLALGAPTGAFDFLAPTASHGLYPPNLAKRWDWGPVPSLLHTNELGLRATRLGEMSSRAKGRIVAIGDSITHGFFVDDVDSWPFILQGLIDAKLGEGWQVLNAARGGASLPKELSILREIALPLEPDVILLTFVTNDISDLRDEKHETPHRYPLEFRAENLALWERTGIWLATKTALGETLLELYWNGFVRKENVSPAELSDGRYAIAKGDRFAENSARFLRKHTRSEGTVLVAAFPEKTQELVDRYLALLAEYARESRTAGAKPVLIYFPAYPQVYAPGTPLLIRDVLQEEAALLNIPFLDLTATFRQRGAAHVLHMAPLDYHLNPAGNQVFAEAVFEFLLDRNMVR